jgi:hypothetical protein
MTSFTPQRLQMRIGEQVGHFCTTWVNGLPDHALVSPRQRVEYVKMLQFSSMSVQASSRWSNKRF